MINKLKIKKIYNIAYSDIKTFEDGKIMKWYKTYINMLTRCYSKKYQLKEPSYIGCSVCDEWLIASNFKKWYDKNYIDGYQLDKDILVYGNKIYSPETCCFIPRSLNSLFLLNNKRRGDCKLGVHVNNGLYRVKLQDIHIGYYKNENDAYNAYIKAKRNYSRSLAIELYMENKISETIMNAIIKYAYAIE